MAIDYDTGNVTCNVCGALIGNYLLNDFHKLIRTKYCKDCKKSVIREQWRINSRKTRTSFRKYKSVIREEIKVKENYIRVLEKQVGINTDSIDKIQDELLRKRGYVVTKCEPIRCGNCGEIQEGGHKYCRECGILLSPV